MNSHLTKALAASVAVLASSLSAFAGEPVVVHGRVQSDILFPETDYTIGTEEYSDKVLTNTYAEVGLYNRYVDAGLRFEYLEHPLPGFIDDFRGWGFPHFYATGKLGGFELTAGDFYEQFGSGFILRTYEDRTLGVDNAIRGARLRVNALQGIRFTALGGVQRRFWDWSSRSKVFGANFEWDMQQHLRTLREHGINWTLAASYVLKHERDEEKLVSGTNYRLNLPHNVSAFDVRTHFNIGPWGLLAEYAWKGQDPSYFNEYTYRHGSAIMLSATYSRKGLGALVQAKRSDNMDFRTRRSEEEAAAYLNNMPPFNYQHTYTLAAMYPYATQAAPGEWAFQGALSYKFARGTALGGRYGTKLSLNASYICGIDRERVDADNIMGTDLWKDGWGGFGETYYSDINLQMEKRITPAFTLNAMYMFQKYNQRVITLHGGMVNSNIFVVDGKFRLSRKSTLRAEIQYLQTRQDQRDWLFGLVEYSWAPYLMLTASDQWNVGDTGTHYYLFSVTGTYRNNRLLVGYGRTRAGYNCAGGVCRYIPATRGLQIAYSYNF